MTPVWRQYKGKTEKVGEVRNKRDIPDQVRMYRQTMYNMGKFWAGKKSEPPTEVIDEEMWFE